MEINNDFNENDSSITYVTGLGILPKNSIYEYYKLLRRNSNIMALSIILYFLSLKFLYKPTVLLLYFLNFNIDVNFQTGLIMMPELDHIVINFTISVLSIFVPILLCFCLYKKDVRHYHIFKKPKKEILSLSIPIIISMGFLSYFIAYLVHSYFKTVGMVFDSYYVKTTHINLEYICGFITTLILAVLQELLFRGIILCALRKYGDEFAIIISSVLFSLWGNSLSEIISNFFLGLILSYFVIKGESIHIAVLGRISLLIILSIVRISVDTMDKSLLEVLSLLLLFFIIFVSFVSFIRYIKKDDNALRLSSSSVYNNIPLQKSIGIFCSSTVFIFLAAAVFIHIASNMQIIG